MAMQVLHQNCYAPRHKHTHTEIHELGYEQLPQGTFWATNCREPNLASACWTSHLWCLGDISEIWLCREWFLKCFEGWRAQGCAWFAHFGFESDSWKRIGFLMQCNDGLIIFQGAPWPTASNGDRWKCMLPLPGWKFDGLLGGSIDEGTIHWLVLIIGCYTQLVITSQSSNGWFMLVGFTR